MTEIKNRSEILFLYDIQNANPNGDPNDENKPRTDEETGRNLVTDVRLKRTIRDYLWEKKQDIFVREKVHDEEGHIQDAKSRANDYLPQEGIKEMSIEKQKQAISDAILSQCIDVRLFGATIPLELKGSKKKNKPKKAENAEISEEITDESSDSKSEKDSLTYTGPVQFKMGKSLHAVNLLHIKGTGAFASNAQSKQKTFREEHFVSYSLVAFSGVINEKAAEHTKLKKEDIKLLKEAMWNGTKGLISRSKFGQMPRLLLVIHYNKPHFFMGDLDHLIALKSDLRDEQIRQVEDYRLDISRLVETIEKHQSLIASIEFISDERIKLVVQKEGKEVPFKLSEIKNSQDITSEVIYG